MLISPYFWDILQGFVTNDTLISYLSSLYEARTYRNDNDEDYQYHIYGGGTGRVQALRIGCVAVAGLHTSGSFGCDWFLGLHDDRHHPKVRRQNAAVV